MPKNLTDLPNIGEELANRLVQVGIHSDIELKAIGAKEVFIRLKTIDPGACINMLYAIEGAIQNIRWHHLDKPIKHELKEFFNRLQSTTI